jgi:hypothetical protein
MLMLNLNLKKYILSLIYCYSKLFQNYCRKLLNLNFNGENFMKIGPEMTLVEFLETKRALYIIYRKKDIWS